MRKKFNDTGLCIPRRHYMADTSQKIHQILHLVKNGAYFTINRPRQFGKTTTLSLLTKHLNQHKDYIAISISFEDIDSPSYQDQEQFITIFLDMLRHECQFLGLSDLSDFITRQLNQSHNIRSLSRDEG